MSRPRRDWTATIGDLPLFSADDVPSLREMVARVRQMKAEGRDHLCFIDEFVKRHDLVEAGHRADAACGAAETWEQSRDKYLEWVKANRTGDTWRGYRSTLGAVPGGAIEEDFLPLRGNPLASVTLADMVKVRENVLRRGKRASSSSTNIRQANLTVSVLKAFWAWQMNREDNVLLTNPSNDLGKTRVRDKTVKAAGSAAAQRSLLQDETGLIILGLETYQNVQARTAVMLQLDNLGSHKSAAIRQIIRAAMSS